MNIFTSVKSTCVCGFKSLQYKLCDGVMTCWYFSFSVVCVMIMCGSSTAKNSIDIIFGSTFSTLQNVISSLFSHNRHFFSLFFFGFTYSYGEEDKAQTLQNWSFSLRRLLLTTVASKLNEKRSLTFEDVARIGTRRNRNENQKEFGTRWNIFKRSCYSFSL